jgi:hypothetical protein
MQTMTATTMSASLPRTVVPSRILTTPIVLSLGMLPWLGVTLWTGGIAAAGCLLGYTLMVLSVGYAAAAFALVGVRVNAIALAPALGIFLFAGTGGLGLRLGLSLRSVFLLWIVMALVGAVALWNDRSTWTSEPLPYGKTLIALSAVICLVYFVPGAIKDAVVRSDGSYGWMYVDTQHFYAIAAAIKSTIGAPRSPGSVAVDLNYHFGPYVPAAMISSFTGLDLGDSLVRVTRAVALWSLVFSTFALGTVLSVKATGEKIGGLFSVIGLFFYGSIMSLFSNEANSSSPVTGAILYRIPGIEVVADGGPFSHLVLGHSVLHGLVAITAVMGLCLMAVDSGANQKWRQIGLLVLPALALPNNSVAALYLLAAVGIILFWESWRSPWSWLSVLAMVGLFLAAWWLMGFRQSTDAAGAGIKHNMLAQWPAIVIWFTIGLGFRLLAFQWISKSFRDHMSVLVAATFVGFLVFDITLHLYDDNERYGIYFLQALFSIFAFSRLKSSFWLSEQRKVWSASWFRLAGRGLAVLAGIAVLARLALFLAHTHTDMTGLGQRAALALLVAALCFGAATLMRRSSRFAGAASVVLMAVLAVGIFAWITPWLNFGIGRMKMPVSVSAAEVAELHLLDRLAAPDERFATNRHEIDSLAKRRARSYGYGAISERPVLVEGYLDRGLIQLPWFHSLLRDNDLMFTTTDPDTLHRLAKQYQVQWLVAQPGSDLALQRPLPPWLIEEQRTGSLKIYKVN